MECSLVSLPSQTHDRLASAAFTWCEEVAKRFDAPAPNGAPSAGSGPSGTSTAAEAAAPVDAEAAGAAAETVAPAAAEGTAEVAGEAAASEAAPAAAMAAAPVASEMATAPPVTAIPPAPAPAAAKPSKPLPIPIDGTFTAVHKPSTKTVEGKEQFVVTIPWADDMMYAKAKLAMYVPPIAKVISTTLPQKPRDGSLSVTLHLPSSVGTDSFQLGAVSITSGPKPMPP